TPDRYLHSQQVVSRGRQCGGLVECLVHVRLGEGRADPRPGRLPEEVYQFAPGDAVGVDALDGSVDHPARLFHGDLAAIRLTEELRLQREVDRARRDVEGQLLRIEVVLTHG